MPELIALSGRMQMVMDISQVTETQIGAIAENLVATQLILASKGRLSPFKPIADDRGIDLLVYDKETGIALPLQIKSRTKALKRHPKTIHFEVRCATFYPKQTAYLLAVFFVPFGGELTIYRAWLIPMKELEQVAMKRAEKLVIRPSMDEESKDRYSQYRCKNIAEVAQKLITRFKESKGV